MEELSTQTQIVWNKDNLIKGFFFCIPLLNSYLPELICFQNKQCYYYCFKTLARKDIENRKSITSNKNIR